MLTDRLRRVVGCIVVLMICTASVTPPVHAFAVESETMEPAGIAAAGESFGLGSVRAWLETLWRPLASFWAMDGAKIMEGG